MRFEALSLVATSLLPFFFLMKTINYYEIISLWFLMVGVDFVIVGLAMRLKILKVIKDISVFVTKGKDVGGAPFVLFTLRRRS